MMLPHLGEVGLILIVMMLIFGVGKLHVMSEGLAKRMEGKDEKPEED